MKNVSAEPASAAGKRNWSTVIATDSRRLSTAPVTLCGILWSTAACFIRSHPPKRIAAGNRTYPDMEYQPAIWIAPCLPANQTESA